MSKDYFDKIRQNLLEGYDATNLPYFDEGFIQFCEEQIRPQLDEDGNEIPFKNIPNFDSFWIHSFFKERITARFEKKHTSINWEEVSELVDYLNQLVPEYCRIIRIETVGHNICFYTSDSEFCGFCSDEPLVEGNWTVSEIIDLS